MSTWTFAKALAKKYFAISEKNFSRSCSLHRKPLSWTFCSTLIYIYIFLFIYQFTYLSIYLFIFHFAKRKIQNLFNLNIYIYIIYIYNLFQPGHPDWSNFDCSSGWASLGTKIPGVHCIKTVFYAYMMVTINTWKLQLGKECAGLPLK